VRIALEGVSAADSALHGTEDDFLKVEQLIAKMKSALKDKKQFAALDLEFHVALANASGNALLSDLISLIRNQLAKALTKVLLLPTAIPLSHKEHIAIFEAIKRRDPEAAREEMQAHLRAGLHRYAKATAGENRRPLGKTSKASTNGSNGRGRVAIAKA
jgi:GntR family transcriptional repressor for pyruvate dehydrogenase complex